MPSCSSKLRHILPDPALLELLCKGLSTCHHRWTLLAGALDWTSQSSSGKVSVLPPRLVLSLLDRECLEFGTLGHRVSGITKRAAWCGLLLLCLGLWLRDWTPAQTRPSSQVGLMFWYLVLILAVGRKLLLGLDHQAMVRRGLDWCCAIHGVWWPPPLKPQTGWQLGDQLLAYLRVEHVAIGCHQLHRGH